MKRILAFTMIVSFNASLSSSSVRIPTSAQPPATDAPRPEQTIGSHAGKADSDITYCSVDRVALKLDLYFPKSLTRPAPIVVWVHGGGGSGGDKRYGAGVVDGPALLDAGFIVASLNYRVAPQAQFPAMIEDVKCAIRFLRAHASQYNIDADRTGAWGASAGGGLVSLLGTTDQDAGFDVGQYLDQSSRVQAVVDMFGPADLTRLPNGSVKLRPVLGSFDLVKASPVTYVTPDDPPFLILHGDADTTTPLSQSQELYETLSASGVNARLIVVRGGPHGLNAPNEIPSRAELLTTIVQFFEQHLK